MLETQLAAAFATSPDLQYLDRSNLDEIFRELSSILRLGPLRSSNLAHLDIDILPHFVGGWFGRPGGSEAWRPGFWGAV